MHVDINSAPDFKPLVFGCTNKHVQSRSSFEAQLDPGIYTDTHCIKVSIIDIIDPDVKPNAGPMPEAAAPTLLRELSSPLRTPASMLLRRTSVSSPVARDVAA